MFTKVAKWTTVLQNVLTTKTEIKIAVLLNFLKASINIPFPKYLVNQILREMDFLYYRTISFTTACEGKGNISFSLLHLLLM